MSLFGLGKTAEIEIVFDDEDSRKAIEMKVDKDQKARFPLYFDGETVRGQVLLRVRDGKRIEHQGVRIQFIG
ncbi:vacuolar protein sorting-associated protein 26, partial [Caulochytrium protostelioides]